MSDIPSALKGPIDLVRGIPGLLNLRPYQASVIKRSWSGERPGVGTSTITTNPLLVAGQRPRVERLSQREILASNGKYQDQDLRITITPSYSTGGYNVSDFSINDADTTPTEIFFLIIGNGTPSAGTLYKKVEQSVSSNLTYKIIIRATGETL